VAKSPGTSVARSANRVPVLNRGKNGFVRDLEAEGAESSAGIVFFTHRE
jgi:hypothetical protein